MDAYSQLVSAAPLKDRTSGSIRQSWLQHFSFQGWPEAIYLDNETSFQNSTEFLEKETPVKILYGVPHCQLQKWSGNYIENSKKILSKILHDVKDSLSGEDWFGLLPMATQSLNRHIIPEIGMSREAIHFNMDVEYHPFACLGSEYEAMLTPEVKPESSDTSQKVSKRRKRNRKNPKKESYPSLS